MQMANNININKSEIDSFRFLMIPYKSIQKPFGEVYTDFSLFTIPYESLKDGYNSISDSYSSLKKSFTEIYLDYSSLDTPYKSLDTGYSSLNQ